mmetsp:Transcript_59683/g.129260  ORF Transcript_59683/g.129260 Transcript_59683/m.129260 type:complete len:214 (+) Transcript_59683:71-712(+)
MVDAAGLDAGSQTSTVTFQVLVAGAAGAGKSSVIRAALNDIALVRADTDEEADGLRLQRALYDLGGQLIVIEFVEFPADERYLPVLASFGAGSACTVFAAHLADPSGVSDLEARAAALAGRPPHGVVIACGAAGGPSERSRLAQLQDLAVRCSLEFTRCESLEQLERTRLLRIFCDLVLRDTPDRGLAPSDPLHLLGTGATRCPNIGSPTVAT